MQTETVFVVPETSVGNQWEQFTIRGKCSSNFFLQCVKQFYEAHATEIGYKDADARQTVSGEWITLFQAKKGFYTLIFGNEHNFIISQVPFLERILESSPNYGTGIITIN